VTSHQPPPPSVPPPSVPLDQPKPMPATAGFPHVAGRCPACRGSLLFLAEAGHVTCSRLDCPAPWAADNLLHGITEADPDASRRRGWTAALRWEAQQIHPGKLEGEGDRGYYAACLEIDAQRIESGALSPWAYQPEPNEPVADVLAAFARGPHGVTAPPPPRVEASGVRLDEPPGQRTATAQAVAATDEPPVCGREMGPMLVGGRIHHCELPHGHPLPHREGGTVWQPVDRSNPTPEEVAAWDAEADEQERMFAQVAADTPEPSAAPDQPAQDALAAAAPTPGTQADLASGGDAQSQPAVPLASTPTGPAILGRALLHLTSGGQPNAWVERDGWWHSHIASVPLVRDEVNRWGDYRDIREVLLVDPAVARVLEAVSRWRHICTAISPDIGQSDVDDAESDVWAAVDALGDTTEAEPTPEPAGRDHHWIEPEEVVGSTPPWRVEAGPPPTVGTPPADPPPAGGPGWDRDTVALARAELHRFPSMQAALDALLADWDIAVRQRDSLARRCAVRFEETQAGRAELAEARRIVAETVEANYRWAADHAALAAEHERELAAARRDAAADALEWAREQLDPAQVGTTRMPPAVLRRIAAEIRAGTRQVPGSPEPDGGGDGADHG
jgi:hypothetical protein